MCLSPGSLFFLIQYFYKSVLKGKISDWFFFIYLYFLGYFIFTLVQCCGKWGQLWHCAVVCVSPSIHQEKNQEEHQCMGMSSEFELDIVCTGFGYVVAEAQCMKGMCY